jgi:hypothetical protein
MALPRKNFQDFSGAVQAHTTENLRSSNQVLHALNADFDVRLGGIVGRKGSLVISTVDAYRLLNLFVYKYGLIKKYVAVLDNGTNTVIYLSATDNFAGTWSSAKSLTTGKEVFLQNFIGKAFYFNGQDTPQSTSDFSSFSNVTNAPAAGKFPVVYNQRLYVLTEDGYLWYSDVVGSDGLSFTSDSWTSRGINPNDGQKCKFAIRHRGKIVIFKEESMYRYDGTNEPEAVITVGTHSWRSVIIGTNGNLYHHHPTGIYETISGLPTLISRPVQKYLDGMSSANWEYATATKDNKNVYFWIGDVTINDPLAHDYNKTYSDCVLVFNVFTRRWSVWSGLNIRTAYYDKITGLTYFGAVAGKVVKMNVNYVDKDGLWKLFSIRNTMIIPKKTKTLASCSWSESFRGKFLWLIRMIRFTVTRLKQQT